jgi:hypothetical protein
MAEPNSMPDFTIVQLAEVAPNVSTILKTYSARIRADISTGDVVNTYGFSITFKVFIEVLTDTCERCGETTFGPPVFDCVGHKFKKHWREVADGESKDGLAVAIANTERKATEWLKRRS